MLPDNDHFFKINVNALLEDLALTDLPQEEKQKFAELVKSNVLAKLEFHLDSLIENEQERNDLNAVADNPELVIDFFKSVKGVDFQSLVAKFSIEVREELLQDVAYIKGSIAAEHNIGGIEDNQ
jgi:hypothetical protein